MTKAVSNDDFIIPSSTKNSVIPAPMPPTSHQNKPPSRPQVRPLESDAALVSVKRRSVFMLVGGWRFGGLVEGKPRQKCPPPTALCGPGPKFLKKAKAPAGRAAIIAPPRMDILP